VTSLCSDRSGNVWVGTSIDGTGTLTEYAHGGDKPIATLSLPDAVALDCDVDRSGDLAVAEAVNSVSVYQNERGTPQTFRDESMGEIYALTYDTRGNLFIYGTQRESFNYPLLGELPTGGSAFSNQEFDEKIQMPTFARWHGKNILLGGVTKRIKGTWTETVWTVAVSTSGLKIVNAKTFDAPAKHRGIGQSGLLQGDTLIQQDYSGNTIWLFSYTAGGEPSKMLRNSRGSHLTALTISE
jgi:hypothetical protein